MRLQKTSQYGFILTAMLDKMAGIFDFNTGMNVSKKGDLYIAISLPALQEEPNAPGIPPEQAKQIASQLKNLNYRPLGYGRKATYTKLVNKENFDQVKTEVQNFATQLNIPLDLKGFDDIQKLLTYSPGTENVEGVEGTPQIGTAPELDIPTQIKLMPDEKKAEMVGDLLSKYLAEFALSVDSAKKQDFVKNFTRLSQHLWHYSFYNQMLILLQTMKTPPAIDKITGKVTDEGGPATDVAGKQRWETLGRTLKQGAKGIVIFYPMGFKKKVTDPTTGQPIIKKDETGKPLALNGKPQYEEQFISSGKFGTTYVYDYRQTQPIPGAKDVYETPTKDWWQSQNNTDDEKSVMLKNAIIKFAMAYNLPVDLSEDTGSAGGYATKDRISIHRESRGYRQINTLLHELAHQYVIFNLDKKATQAEESKEKGNRRAKDPDAIRLNKKYAEVDAETVAHLVSRHFGFPSEMFSANYLALSGASTKDVLFRTSTIQEVAKWLITGVTKYLPNVPKSQGQLEAEKTGKIKAPPKMENQPVATPAPAPASTVTVPPQGQPVPVPAPVAQAWVKRHCKFAQIMSKNAPEEPPSVENTNNPIEIEKDVQQKQQLKKTMPQLEKSITDQKSTVKRINRDPHLTPLVNTLNPGEIKALYKLDDELIKDPTKILPSMTVRIRQEHKKEYPDNAPKLPTDKMPGKMPTKDIVQEQLKQELKVKKP